MIETGSASPVVLHSELSVSVYSTVPDVVISSGFSDEIPFVSGSALMALQALEGGQKARGEDKWVDLIFKLMDSVDDYIPTPERDTCLLYTSDAADE